MLCVIIVILSSLHVKACTSLNVKAACEKSKWNDKITFSSQQKSEIYVVLDLSQGFTIIREMIEDT